MRWRRTILFLMSSCWAGLFQRSTDALETNDPLLDVVFAGMRDEHQINVAN